MLGCVWERYSSMRVFHELLDTLTQQDYAYPTATHFAGGFLQTRFGTGARRYASNGTCLFLCPSLLWWAAYLGGVSLAASTRSANPDMSSTAKVFAGLSGGFKSLYWSLS